MRHILGTLICCIISISTFSQLKINSISDIDSDISEEVNLLLKKQKRFVSYFTGLYDIVQIKDILTTTHEDIAAVKNKLNGAYTEEEIQVTLKMIAEHLTQIELVYDAFQGLNQNQEFLSEDYFKLWNEVFKQKIKVDKLYIKINVSSNSYAGQNEQKFKEVRKKGIYYPCQKLYDHYLVKVRNTNQCDYITRIEILNKTKTLLFKMEELANGNTRTIEKQLKKLGNISDIENYLSLLSI